MTDKHWPPWACLNDGCSRLFVGKKAWKKTMDHMKGDCSRSLRNDAKVPNSKQVVSYEKATMILGQHVGVIRGPKVSKVQRELICQAAGDSVGKTLVPVCIRPMFACIHTGCLFGSNEVKLVTDHMKHCQSPKPRTAKTTRKQFLAASRSKAARKNTPFLIEFAKNTNKKSKKSKSKARKKANQNEKPNHQDNSLVSSKRKMQRVPNGKDSIEYIRFYKRTKEFGFIVPLTNFAFVHIRQKVTPVKLDERKADFLADNDFDLARYEYEFRRRKMGSSRGGRKSFRQDRSWEQYAALPPRILTKHARERLVERGSGSIPRFVPGTRKTIVATFVPNKHPKGRKRYQQYRAFVQGKCERERRHRAHKGRKTRLFKKSSRRCQKRGLLPRRIRQRCMDFAKSGSAYCLTRHQLIPDNRAKLREPRYYRHRYVSSSARRDISTRRDIVERRIDKKKRTKTKEKQKMMHKKQQLQTQKQKRKKDPAAPVPVQSSQSSRTCSFACLGYPKCTFCADDWSVAVKHIRECPIYGQFSARGTMKRSQKIASGVMRLRKSREQTTLARESPATKQNTPPATSSARTFTLAPLGTVRPQSRSLLVKRQDVAAFDQRKRNLWEAMDRALVGQVQEQEQKG